jgi:N-acetylmuramoyl-L-alanine amidase
MARDQHAELFVSLHADALAGGGASVQGATVYTVSERASDAEAARVAEHENNADSAAGVEAREDASDVSDILFDLTRRETRAYSHVFAHSLSEYWKVAARLNKNPRRSAGFVVLKAPDVPSVLLELGYLSNDSDASDLSSSAWREKAAAQVAQSIDAFFASRPPENRDGPVSEGDRRGGALKATQSGGN